jgi:formate hydrogenlyase transcriptional activator
MGAAANVTYTRATPPSVSQGMSGPDPHDDLLQLAATASRARGDTLFAVLAQTAAKALGASSVLVTHAIGRDRVRTLAALKDGVAQPNYEYDLAGTPCAAVLQGDVVHVGNGLAERFPLTRQGYQGYYGAPLLATDGSVVGHLCAQDAGPLPVSAQQRLVCEILAAHGASELQRLRVEKQMRTRESSAELERERLQAHNRYLREEIRSDHNFDEIIGTSPALVRVLENVGRVAPTEATVLLTGETGTGKELLARSIHDASRRAEGPFIKVDCAARYPRHGEEDLFGDANEGALEIARGGSIFLDEIGELTPDAQARLVRVLQQPLDARVIAATNRDLRGAVQDGRFREDLYYRLNVFPIELPPLRSRGEDIPLLVRFFAQKYAPRVGRHVAEIDPDTLAAFSRYPWPGNVRELENLVERALVLNTSPVLKLPPEMLGLYTPDERGDIAAAATGMQRMLVSATHPPMSLDDTENTGLHHVQREHILRVLNATHWVIEGNHGAALKLGMKPATLRHRMKKLGIARALNPVAQVAPGSEIR